MIELFVHPTCTSCRKAEALLAEAGAEVARRDYFRDRFTVDELRDVLGRAGLTPSEALSTRAKAYQSRGLGDQDLSDDQLLDLMVEEPTLLLAVQGVVGRVEIKDDLLGRPRVRVQEQVDEQVGERGQVVTDLVIAVIRP